jgi:hypothetical protein
VNATAHEIKEFHQRLEIILDQTREQLKKLESGGYVLRAMIVRAHNVRAHTRAAYRRLYLAKNLTKRARP